MHPKRTPFCQTSAPFLSTLIYRKPYLQPFASLWFGSALHGFFSHQMAASSTVALSCFSSVCWSEWGVGVLRRRFLTNSFLSCKLWSHMLAHREEPLCFYRSLLCCASFRRKFLVNSVSCTLWRSSRLGKPLVVWISTTENYFPHQQRRRMFRMSSLGRASECYTRGREMTAFWHWWCQSGPGLCPSFAPFQTQWPHPLRTRCATYCTESVWAARLKLGCQVASPGESLCFSTGFASSPSDPCPDTSWTGLWVGRIDA